MTTEQLLTKIREFATNNYCSCEGRIHDPYNLMEKLLRECDKWGKEAKMTKQKSKKLPTNNETVKFKDLKFKPLWGGTLGDDRKKAVMFFENGYGVSVLFGNYFYSNGVDTYELAVLKEDGELDYDNPVINGNIMIGNLKKNKLMKLINQVKNFK